MRSRPSEPRLASRASKRNSAAILLECSAIAQPLRPRSLCSWAMRPDIGDLGRDALDRPKMLPLAARLAERMHSVWA